MSRLKVATSLSPSEIAHVSTPDTAPNKLRVDTTSAVPNSVAEVAETFKALFDPPTVFNRTLNAYVVDCHHTIPTFSVTIGGHTPIHELAELVVQTGLGFRTPPP
ncbi:hypothetical protein BJY01DRAFT_254215 [Aspergillus pseudoustus]|uniref:Uncharacterized protein n=1 Tax=Aspergillus pseudoustus TaxID=1810923 RepID=A0ABR4IV03_9EURO